MKILFSCTGCGAQYNVPVALGGKKAQCKKCGVVTKIPMPVAAQTSGELNFRDEPPEPSLDSSTISGTIHSMDTSQRVLDESVYDTAPDIGSGHRPLMRELPKVEMSELDALDFKGPSYGGSGGRGAAHANYAPSESYSLLLAALFILVAVFGLYHDYTTWPAMLTPVKTEYTQLGGPPHAMLVLPRLILVISAFAVLAPLVMIAWFAAGKVTNTRLPSSAYMRSLGLAVLPAATIILLTALPLDMTPASAGTLAVICVPLAFALLVYVHRQPMNLAAVTTGVATVLLVFGLVLTFMGAAAMQDSMRTTYEQKRDVLIQQKEAEKQQRDLALKEEARQKELARLAALKGPPPSSDSTAKAAAALLARLQGMQAKESLATQTRESLGKALDAADAELTTDKSAFPDLKPYPAIADAITALRQTATTLPSENPPTDLAEALPAGTDWTAKSARHEVSVFAYNFVPPGDAVVVLGTDATPTNWKWQTPDCQTQLTISTVAAPAADQKRPWVAPLSITQHVKTPIFAIDAGLQPTIETGSINSQPFTRITSAPESGSMAGGKKVTYVTRADDQWITATIQSASQADTGFTEMERAIGTLHKRPDSMAATDPISAAELVSRYKTSHGPEADAIAVLLKGKPGAEDAVLRAIGATADTNSLQQFGPLLASVATSHAVPTLWKIAPLGGPASEDAREALRTLDPKNADDLNFAIMDLKTGRPAQVKSAISTLASADVQKTRMFDVGRALAAVDRGALMSADEAELVTALGKWMNDENGRTLTKLLDSDTASEPDRKLAIKALGATGNRRYAYAITKCVTRESDVVVDTLIAMGPSVEIDVDPLLRDTDPIARKSAAMILQEIGTQKSLSPLQSAIALSGDPEFKESAGEAMNRIRDRAKTTTSQPTK